MTTYTRKATTGEDGNPGEFGTRNHDEGDATLAVATAQTVTASIVARDEKYSLVFVDRDESLTDDQCTAYLSGDSNEFYDQMLGVFDERAFDSATEQVEEECRNHDIARSDMEDDDWQALVEEVMNRDTSDPINDLIRGTPSKLMRAPIAKIGVAANGTGATWGNDDGARAARVQLIERALGEHGVDCGEEGVTEAVEELVDNGPYDWHEGVDLDVIWHGPIGDAALFRDTHDLGRRTSGRKLSFPAPEILLIDRWNGSGHSVKVPAPIAITVSKDAPVDLDSQCSGYGWDEVAGVVHSAFRQDVASEWLENQPELATS